MNVSEGEIVQLLERQGQHAQASQARSNFRTRWMGSQDHSAILSQLSLDPSSLGDKLGEPLSRGRQRWWRQYRPARAKERRSLGGWKPRLRGEAAPSSADLSAGQRAHQANARPPSPLNPLKPDGSATGVCSWHRPCVRLARRSCG
jgi:hypothetical protein